MNQKRVWIYYRTAQPDVDALEMQKACLEAYASSQGCYIGGITAEHGSGLVFSLKGLDVLLHAANSGIMDFILVKDISRLGRNVLAVAEYIDQIKECGVQVICADGEVFEDYADEMLAELIKSANIYLNASNRL